MTAPILKEAAGKNLGSDKPIGEWNGVKTNSDGRENQLLSNIPAALKTNPKFDKFK